MKLFVRLIFSLLLFFFFVFIYIYVFGNCPRQFIKKDYTQHDSQKNIWKRKTNMSKTPHRFEENIICLSFYCIYFKELLNKAKLFKFIHFISLSKSKEEEKIIKCIVRNFFLFVCIIVRVINVKFYWNYLFLAHSITHM